MTKPASAAASLSSPSPSLFSESGSLAQDSRFFELRTYHAGPGKLDALHARFRDHTNKIFADHGMQIVGFWVPMSKEGRYDDTLVYILAFPDKAARDKVRTQKRDIPEGGEEFDILHKRYYSEELKKLGINLSS